MTNHHVQAASLTAGTLFPVVVLDDHPRWTQSAAGAAPEPATHPAGLLVLRAAAPAGRARDGLTQLQAAAAQFPKTPPTAQSVAELHRRLPPYVQAVALPAPALYGPWTARTPTAA
ncbi:hypothetical protein ACFY2H_30630 [Streptomyces griseofuscus]|uniref:hypothetical protein n=1 Tax=Streptomycetaceae TaxID=2062 RepID=UPI00056D322A|nr:hypothetical protein [Actinacidiphila yeochonensis]